MFHTVKYKNKKYCVMEVMYKSNKIPVIFDSDYEPVVKRVSEKWNCSTFGVISCSYYNNLDQKYYNIRLHDLVMSIIKHQKQLPSSYNQDKIILHINKLCLDNRSENLIYDTIDKMITKNMKKKHRYLTLPENCDIDPNELPTYVWYAKPEGTHGERFVINIGKILWKSTSSRKVSLRFKLEEAKNFLRKLKIENSELFRQYSMNGDYNIYGEKLLESFFDIIHQAGYTHIKRIDLPNSTDDVLCPKELNSLLEKNIFQNNILECQNDGKRNIIKNIPLDIPKLPQYCYYRQETSLRGECFIIKNHPKSLKCIYTSTSKDVSLKDKYKQLLNNLSNLQQ